MSTDLALDLVPGVFASREQAEGAIAQLRALGIEDADIGIAVPNPGEYRIVEDEELPTGTGRRITEGAIIGAPVGSLAGLGIMEALVPGAGSFGLGGVLVGLVGGGLWGTFFGAYSGLIAKLRGRDGHEHTCTIPLGGSDVLVAVRASTQTEHVRQVMQAYGARCFLDEVELSDGAAATSP